METLIPNAGFDLERWAKEHKVQLNKEDCSPNRHHFYVSSQLGETFQIVIEPERENSRRIDAHLIESPTDEEAHFMWEFPISQIKNALDLALGNSQTWFQRGAR